MVHLCVNGTMQNTNNYSSPVPVIGLYIAAGSFICFLLILCDVWAGFRSKMFWFPSRLFSINSITLSLLSIATKLPVDLTTAMPSAQDQLSKLTGTVFICMTMIFMLPSLVINVEFESNANVTPLSIFVFTVIVNISIQMATGVIFSFIAEHVIILVCMLLLLIRFWTSVAHDINGSKGENTEFCKDLIRLGEKSLLKRVTVCYQTSYGHGTQLFFCQLPFTGSVSLICTMCSVVLVQAILRSLCLKDIKFCHEVSDYGWSVWLVVVSQILSVALVSLAIGIRLLTLLPHKSLYVTLKLFDLYLPFQYFFSVRRFPKLLEKSFRYVIYSPLTLVDFSVMASNFFVQITLRLGLVKCGILNVEGESDETWAGRKSQEDMERWMKFNRQASLKHLTNLFSTLLPSEEPSSYTGLKHRGIKISSLSMILTAEVAKIVIAPVPPNKKVSLAKILDEAYDIIHFIDSKLNLGTEDDRTTSMSAHIIHEYGLPNGVGEMILKDVLYQGRCSFPKTACVVIQALTPETEQAIEKVTTSLANFINYRSSESIEVVYDRIEQLFVDMLHVFLSQLPVAIFAHIVESTLDEYLERVRLCLGFLCKLESLKPHIRFSSLPPDSGITSLFDTDTDTTDAQEVDTQMQGQGTLHITTTPEAEHGEIQEMTPHVTLPLH